MRKNQKNWLRSIQVAFVSLVFSYVAAYVVIRVVYSSRLRHADGPYVILGLPSIPRADQANYSDEDIRSWKRSGVIYTFFFPCTEIDEMITGVEVVSGEKPFGINTPEAQESAGESGNIDPGRLENDYSKRLPNQEMRRIPGNVNF